jgi:PIN domain nuclease of toxin-antitoxin system
MEPGAEIVRSVRELSCISTVNLAEVAAKLVERSIDVDELARTLTEGQIEIVPFTESQARLSGELRRATRSRGLALGDRACLALAQVRGLPAVTADAARVGATAAQVLLIR